jgi:hypothetical protein
MNKKVILIFCIALFIFLLVFLMYAATLKKSSLLNKYIEKLVLINSIFIPLGIFFTLTVFIKQLDTMKREATFKIIDRGYLNINKNFVDYYNQCPNFVNSLYFNWQIKLLGNTEIYEKNKDKWYTVKYISIIIFQSWEDFITSSKIDDTGFEVWISNFLQWTNSDILLKNWSVLKSNFADTTKRFGDYLFFKIKEKPPKNDIELYNLSLEIKKNKIFRDIINNRHK